ncbi:hypothetical protein AB0A81_26945 [Streptomyces flaveolus]|uniref:Uncharacterized protein n=1 Tax=Streptomyces flaveolus TaxID=67297 RepID=A0ABV1VET5_9ACTN
MDVNGYGRLAQRHWQKHRRESIAEIGDPEAFFTELGSDVQDELRARWTAERLDEPAVVGESYLERAGRLRQLRHEVEGEVLGELVLLPAGNDVDLVADPHLTSTQIAEERWRERHLHELLAGRCRPGDFSATERARLRSGAPARLLELTGLSDEALRSDGLL